MDARALYKQLKFEEAQIAYSQQLADGIGDHWANVAGVGTSLMALGRYLEAIPFLTEVGQYEKSAVAGSIGRDLAVSTCEWLSGSREKGVAIMRSLVTGILDGSVTYAVDQAGGLVQGLLLNYMAITGGNTDDAQLCVRYMKKLVNARAGKNWPGPVAQFVLSQGTFESALQSGVGVSNIPDAIQVSGSDLMKRRRLTNVLFNAGVVCRSSGDEAGCLEYMRVCASLQNPLIEYDWHLARGEIAAANR